VQNKYKLFLTIAKGLNERFSVEPTLYGSFGLYTLIGLDKEVDDIDMLVPLSLFSEQWGNFQKFMEEQGFKLTNELKHEFSNGEHKVSFESEDVLENLINASAKELKVQTEQGARFRVLTLRQYLSFYEKMSEDSSRAQKKGAQDQKKIELIKQEMIAG